jgi:hypothetical protein
MEPGVGTVTEGSIEWSLGWDFLCVLDLPEVNNIAIANRSMGKDLQEYKLSAMSVFRTGRNTTTSNANTIPT